MKASPAGRAAAIAALRALAQSHVQVSANYTGASTNERFLRRWDTASGSADNVSLRALPELRERSSDLIRNEPLAAGTQVTFRDSVVGTGMRLRATPIRRVLGLSREQAKEWADQVEDLWNAVKDELDIERSSSQRELQELALCSTFERGDCASIRRYDKRPGDVLGLKLQMVEADRISNPNGRFNTDLLREGIEKDAHGAPSAMFVADRHPRDFMMRAGPTTWRRVPFFGASSGERLVLHHLRRTRLGQSRGVPIFAPVISHFKKLGKYADAEIEAAVINAMLTVLLQTPGDQVDLRPTAESALAEEAGEIEEGEMLLGSGTVLGLPPGATANIVDPKRPNLAFGPFVDAVLMQIGAALGLPFEVLTKRFQSSYSAARAALLEAWRHFYGWREWLAESFCTPVYAWVLSEAIATGLIDAPGFFDSPLLRKAWLKCEWVGDAPGQVDELKEAKAAELRLKMGVSTLAEETAALTGGDWERNHEQRAEETARRRLDGLEGPSAADLEEADRIIDDAERREAA